MIFQLKGVNEEGFREVKENLCSFFCVAKNHTHTATSQHTVKSQWIGRVIYTKVQRKSLKYFYYNNIMMHYALCTCVLCLAIYLREAIKVLHTLGMYRPNQHSECTPEKWPIVYTNRAPIFTLNVRRQCWMSILVKFQRSVPVFLTIPYEALTVISIYIFNMGMAVVT